MVSKAIDSRRCTSDDVTMTLRDHRLLVGWSQMDLAKALLTHQQCVSRWETGVVSPTARMRRQIADVLSVRVSDINWDC